MTANVNSIKILISDDDKYAIKTAAAKARKTMSAYIKEVVFKDIKKREEKEKVRQN